MACTFSARGGLSGSHFSTFAINTPFGYPSDDFTLAGAIPTAQRRAPQGHLIAPCSQPTHFYHWYQACNSTQSSELRSTSTHITAQMASGAASCSTDYARPTAPGDMGSRPRAWLNINHFCSSTVLNWRGHNQIHFIPQTASTLETTLGTKLQQSHRRFTEPNNPTTKNETTRQLSFCPPTLTVRHTGAIHAQGAHTSQVTNQTTTTQLRRLEIPVRFMHKVRVVKPKPKNQTTHSNRLEDHAYSALRSTPLESKPSPTKTKPTIPTTAWLSLHRIFAAAACPTPIVDTANASPGHLSNVSPAH